jgi:hypothetical protein
VARRWLWLRSLLRPAIGGTVLSIGLELGIPGVGFELRE